MEPAVQLGRCGRTNKEDAMRTYLIGAGLLLSLTAPALAEEFYIVQNPTTKKCTIITERPTTTTTTVVGGTTYTTRTEAQNSLKTTEVCATTRSTTTTTTSDEDDRLSTCNWPISLRHPTSSE
jgi:hypothetical protein